MTDRHRQNIWQFDSFRAGYTFTLIVKSKYNFSVFSFTYYGSGTTNLKNNYNTRLKSTVSFHGVIDIEPVYSVKTCFYTILK